MVSVLMNLDTYTVIPVTVLNTVINKKQLSADMKNRQALSCF